jgi:cellulose synthase/poly-beta-1,6-N-acetylglucosamine synthase-like glycosyltransferase
MAWMLLLILGIAALLVAMHPFVFYPLSLIALRRFRTVPVTPRPPQTSDGPRYAICVCAYNEEAVIQRKAENLLSLRRVIPDLEILIYVDGASDRTADLLAPYALDFRIHVSLQRHGKTHGMNLLVAASRAPIVLFTDANVMLDAASLLNLSRYFADPRVGCVCGHLVYTNSGDSATAGAGSLYWRLEETIKRLETETGSTVGADGSLFAIRRHLHRPPPDDLIDDMYVSLRILCEGYRIVQAQDVVAYEESVKSGSEEFRRKIRIGCQAFNVHRALWPLLRGTDALTRYEYVSHKLLRWLSGYFLAAAWLLTAAGVAGVGYGGLAGFILLSPALLFLLGGVRRMDPFAQLWGLLTSLLGTALGVRLSLRGERFQIWSPAQSIRNKPLQQVTR